jgi:hypothetical protein
VSFETYIGILVLVLVCLGHLPAAGTCIFLHFSPFTKFFTFEPPMERIAEMDSQHGAKGHGAVV